MSSRFPARPYTLRRMAARRVGETQMSFGDTGKDADAMTVSELIERMNGILKGGIPDAWVSGEIADLRRPGSGHLYFSLKDERAAIACVMWRSTVVRLPFEAEEGLLVLARGYPDVYEPSGKLSLVVGDLQPSGIGALQLAFEQLKARLQAEGLFDVARKRPLPLLPRRIGVVLARGGGSSDDLAAFNDEAVVRAIAVSRAPVISAVGHEVDVTLADLAADLRAATPSQAAELVVGRRDAFEQQLVREEKNLREILRRKSEWGRSRLLWLAPAFPAFASRVKLQGSEACAARRGLLVSLRRLPALFEEKISRVDGMLHRWPDRAALPLRRGRVAQEQRAAADRM